MAHNSFNDAKVYDQKRKWSDGVVPFEWDKKADWQRVRFFGTIYTDFRHTVKTKTGKFYPEYCLGYDVENDDHFPNREELCPCCAVNIGGQQRFYCNCIDMEEWENRPANPKPDWSPIRMMELPQTLVKQLKSLVQLNKGESITDPAKGAIVNVKYNSQSDPSTMYAANIDQRNWAIPAEIAAFSVVQVMPDGRKVERKPANGMPGAFVYARIVNKRSEVESSLRRNGYFGDASAETKSDSAAPRRAAEEECGDLPEFKKAPSSKPTMAVEASTDFDPQSLVNPACPAAFGQFADEVLCFTKCNAKALCKAETVKNQTSAKPQHSKPSKDDDDTV